MASRGREPGRLPGTEPSPSPSPARPGGSFPKPFSRRLPGARCTAAPLHRCSRGRRLFPRRNRNINSQLAIPANHVKAFKQKGFLLIRAGWAPIGKRVI